MGIIFDMYNEVANREQDILESNQQENESKQCPCDYGICSECEY